MNYLQYKSDEMYSSTQLIRQSKMIFDKLNKKEIDKAVILRDGKPSFLVMDFKQYETIMAEYIQLKNQTRNLKSTAVKEQKMHNESQQEVVKPNSEESLSQKEQEELQEALAKIDNLDMSSPDDISKEELKEFWD